MIVIINTFNVFAYHLFQQVHSVLIRERLIYILDQYQRNTNCIAFMARGGITKPNLLLLRSYREANRARGGVSKMCGKLVEERYEVSEEGEGGTTVWVPHPRTGIYVPKGQEWVMKDVPEKAATFTPTCWFRNDDDDDDVDLNHPNP